MADKHGALDKYDVYMPNEPFFIHDVWCVSKRSKHFHSRSVWIEDDRFCAKIGIGKRLYRVSGNGICIDAIGVGNSGEST